MLSNDQVWYFGWQKDYGHRLRSWHDQSDRHIPDDFPCPYHALDTGMLPPKKPEIEGLAHMISINGWTIMAFWDRSGDSRPKSNTALIVRGTHTFDAMVKLFQHCFPEDFARFPFALYQLGD